MGICDASVFGTKEAARDGVERPRGLRWPPRGISETSVSKWYRLAGGEWNRYAAGTVSSR
jgi:hypothetical protein